MYLVDSPNNFSNVNKFIYKIDNVKSIDDLKKIFSKKHPIDKILNQFKINIKFFNNEKNLNNLKNLFTSSPINMKEDEVSILFQSIITSDVNKRMSSIEIDDLFNKYSILLKKSLKNTDNLNDKTPYQIVGDIHKSLVNISYGKKVYHKNNLDELLLSVEKGYDDLEIKYQSNFENKKDKIIELSNSIFENNIPNNVINLIDKEYYVEAMDIIREKIEKNNYLKFENFYSKSLYNYKIKQDRKVNKQINYFLLRMDKDLKEQFNIDFNSIKKYDNLFDIASQIEKYKLATIEKINATSNEIGISFINNNIENMLVNVNKVFNTTINNILNVAKFDNVVETNIIKNKNNLVKKHLDFIVEQNPNIDYLTIMDKIRNNSNSKILEFQELNKELLKDESYNNSFKQLTNKKFLGNLKYNIPEVSNLELFSKTLENILGIKDIEKYSIKDIKSFIIILNLDNAGIYNILKDKKIKSINFENNQILKDIFNDKGFELLPQEIKERSKYLYNLINISKNKDKLITNDINFDIQKFIIDNVPMTNYNVVEFSLNKLEELKNSFRNKENILLMMILESLDKDGFNEIKFNDLSNILKQKPNQILESPKYKNVLSTLKDDWLKWSLIYGREIKDYNLITEKIDPFSFDFGEYRTIQKHFNEFKKDIPHLSNVEIEPKYIKYYDLLKKINPEFSYETFFKMVSSIKILSNKNSNIIKLMDESIKYLSLNDKYLDYINLFNTKNEDSSKFKNIIDLIDKLNIIDDSNKYKDLFVNLEALSKISLNLFNTMLYDKEKSKNPTLTLETLEKLLSKINSSDKEEFNTNGFDQFGLKEISKYSVLTKEGLEYLKELIKKSPNYMNTKKWEFYVDYYKTKMAKSNFDIKKMEIPIIKKDLGNGYSYEAKTVKHFDVMFTGEKSNCCITYGGPGWRCISHMYKNPYNNIIFEVYKDGKPIANSWTWMYNNQLTFDNIEAKDKSNIQNGILMAYQDYSLEVIKLKPSIKKITIGSGYGIGNSNLSKISVHDNNPINHVKHKDSFVYTDAKRQYVILNTDNLNLTKEKFKLSKEIQDKFDNVFEESNSQRDFGIIVEPCSL